VWQLESSFFLDTPDSDAPQKFMTEIKEAADAWFVNGVMERLHRTAQYWRS
jgi:hypothetical protein